MKKNLVMALAAILMLASCSKDNGKTNGKASLSVKIDMSKFAVKSGDASIGTLPEWDQLLLVVTDKDGAFVEEKTITNTDFADLTGGAVELITKSDNKKLVGGTVTAYITTTGDDWGVITATGTPNLPTLATGQLDINNWQVSGAIKTGITGKFVNVPYYGQSAAIAKTGMTTDGRELLETAVTVTPELGRIQVINAPNKGGVLNGIEVSSLTITNIYINKITSNSNVVDIRNGNVNVDHLTWKANFYAAAKPLVGMCDNVTDRGYQIFDGNTPHVIVEVEYTLKPTSPGGVEGAKITGYLTIQKFTYKDVTDFVSTHLTVNKGKMYNIDLSELTPTHDQIGEDPYDNTVWHELIATVTVAPWSKIDVKPIL